MAEYSSSRKDSFFGSVDYITLLLYLLLVAIGIVAVFSASWDGESESMFSFSHNYVKQIVFLGVSMWNSASSSA